jgi:hypothetical protein
MSKHRESLKKLKNITLNIIPIVKYSNKMIKNKTEKEYIRLIKEDSENFKLIPLDKQTDKLSFIALQIDWKLLDNIHNQTEELCIYAINKNYNAIKYVKNYNDTICVAAIKKNWASMEFIPANFQTLNLCIESFKNDSHLRAFKFIVNKTPEIYMEAIKIHGTIIKNIPNPTDDMYKASVIQSGAALALIPIVKKTPELCLLAVTHYGISLKNVPTKVKTYEICYAAVNNDGLALEFVPEKFFDKIEILSKAIEDNPIALKYIPSKFQTYDLCEAAISKDGLMLEYMNKEINAYHGYKFAELAVSNIGFALKYVNPYIIDNKLCKKAVEQCHIAIEYVPDQFKTYELCLFAINKYGSNLRFIPDEKKTIELCKIAVLNNDFSIQYVPNKYHTHDFISEYLTKYRFGFQYIKFQTTAIRQMAINMYGDSIMDYFRISEIYYTLVESKEDCSICVGNDNEKYCKLNVCKHEFHLKCLETWFKNKIVHKCPLCIQDIEK